MRKKETIRMLEQQIERLQLKICNGEHKYKELKTIASYTLYDIDFYHHLQCVNCEHKIIRKNHE